MHPHLSLCRRQIQGGVAQRLLDLVACVPAPVCVQRTENPGLLGRPSLLLLPPALVSHKVLLTPRRVNSLEAQLREATLELKQCQQQLQEAQVSSCRCHHFSRHFVARVHEQ